MRLVSSLPQSDNRRVFPWGRATAFLLALGIEILVVLALLGLAPSLPDLPQRLKTISFRLAPEPKITPKAAPQIPVVVKKKHRAGGTPSPAPPAPTPPAPQAPPSWMVSKDEFATADISKMRSTRGNDQPGTGSGSGHDSGSAYGPGEGPGGEQLYNAEWYREPTRAELAYYMPANAQTGWALIACKTVADYHVENCRSLGESPPGSGLARALRLASWQFRILPPRIGGRPMVGAWVRIHYDLTVGVEK